MTTAMRATIAAASTPMRSECGRTGPLARASSRSMMTTGRTAAARTRRLARGLVIRYRAAAGRSGPSVEIQTVSFLENNDVRVAVFFVDQTLFSTKKDLPFDWQQVYGVFGSVDLNTQYFTLLGYLNGGSVHFDAASFTDGDAVKGTFTAELLKVAP